MKIPFVRPISFLFPALAILLFAVFAHAQTQAASGFHLIKISITGLRQFNEAQVIAASKLFPGETVTMTDLNAAANRLAQYGVHADPDTNIVNVEVDFH